MIFSPEALAVLSALTFAPGLPLLHCLLYRQHGGEAKSNADLYISYAIYGLWWTGFSAVLWGLHFTLGQFVAGISTVGFVCLAYMQVFSQICRGFSLRILVDIDRCDGLPLEGVLKEYSDGRGAHWLLDKRLNGLQQVGLIAQEGSRIRLVEPRGRQAGNAGILLKRIIKPGQGG